MKLYTVLIRRDAQTITPATVPEHEVALLQTVHGEENIQNVDGKPICNHPLTDADLAGEAPTPDDEFGRLASKYGANEKGDLIVESVYGKKASKGLEKAMAAAVKPEKRGKQAEGKSADAKQDAE